MYHRSYPPRHAQHRYLVWDNHGCMPLRADATFLPQLERYRDAGVTVASINVGYAQMSCDEHIRVLSYMRRWISERSDTYRLVSGVDDIEECLGDGRLGITFDIEGMVPVQEQPSLVQTFYELGVRWMLIAYNHNNRAGGGCMDEDTGLTETGRRIIDEMERVGMVLCLSHAGERTVQDALAYARNPPIFSHSNPKGEHTHVRNVSDGVMRAVADKGGVVGLSGIGLFVGAAEKDLVGRLLRQLRYTIDLVGHEHVGLGLDYVFDQHQLAEHVAANPSLYPPDVAAGGSLAMLAPSAIADIAEGLARAKLSDGAIRGVLGENWLRVAKQVWK